MSDNAGRLDVLVQNGLGILAHRLGINRNVAQPLINRFVDEKVQEHKMPVTPEAIAEELGILKKRKAPKVEVPR